MPDGQPVSAGPRPSGSGRNSVCAIMATLGRNAVIYQADGGGGARRCNADLIRVGLGMHWGRAESARRSNHSDRHG